MKKFGVLVFAVVMCAVILFSCAKPEPVAKDILDEDGNTVATGYYDGDKLVYEEKVNDKGQLSQKTEYDSEGRVEKIENYTLGKLSSEEEYKYEKKDGEYSKTVTVFNNKGVTVSVKEIKYKDSLPVEEVNTIPSSEDGVSNVERCKYTYNEDGTVLLVITSDARKIRETLVGKDGNNIYDYEIGEESSRKTYYGENNVVLKSESYNKEGALVVTVENQYSEDGKQIGSKSYGANGELKDYSEYVYKDGKLLGIYKYNADGTINSTIAYDADGKLTVHNGMYVHLG